MDETVIRIEKDLRPAYYDDFHCLAEDCKISCCRGWSITFNKKEYLSLRRLKGSAELNALLENGVRRLRKGPGGEMLYGEFNMDKGACPLLGEDCLCRLQKEKGHEALPYVCRTYPRVERYMPSGYLERSLSPACEGVLALLWDLPEGIEFRSDPLPKEKRKKHVPPKDNPLPIWFAVVREWCIDILQDRRFPLPQRIFLMGLGLKELADGEEDIERWMERAAVLPDSVDVKDILPDGDRELGMYLVNSTRMLYEMRNASRKKVSLWKGRTMLYSTEDMAVSLPDYRKVLARYEERFGDRDYFMENLMVTIFYHLQMPNMKSREDLWKGYVNFCNLYGMYRFLAVMSCREGASGDREELFRQIVFASRALIHNDKRQSGLRDAFFKNDSATLAHMAILLCG